MFWSLTGREFNALKYQWALARAQTLNLQADTQGVPFIAEDFMGTADRAQRIAVAESKRRRDKAMLEGEKMRMMGMKMRNGQVPVGIHPAFLGKKKG